MQLDKITGTWPDRFYLQINETRKKKGTWFNMCNIDLPRHSRVSELKQMLENVLARRYHRKFIV